MGSLRGLWPCPLVRRRAAPDLDGDAARAVSFVAGACDDDVANAQQCLSVDGNYKLSDDDCASLLGFVCELDLATLK